MATIVALPLGPSTMVRSFSTTMAWRSTVEAHKSEQNPSWAEQNRGRRQQCYCTARTSTKQKKKRASFCFQSSQAFRHHRQWMSCSSTTDEDGPGGFWTMKGVAAVVTTTRWWAMDSQYVFLQKIWNNSKLWRGMDGTDIPGLTARDCWRLRIELNWHSSWHAWQPCNWSR